MSFFWLDIAALAVTAVIALALTWMVLSAGIRRAANHYFVFFNLAQTASAICGALTPLALWSERGNPQRLLEVNALSFSLACVFLLLFAIHYFDFALRTIRITRAVAVASLVLVILIAAPLFQHRIIYHPRLETSGVVVAEISSLGAVVALIPLVCLMGAGLLFWRRREEQGSRTMLFSVVALLVGFLADALFNWPFPILSVMMALAMAALGNTVMRHQLFNPLKELTADLELRVAERTAALEKAYADLTMQSAESIAARAEAERARQAAEVANQALQAQIWLANGQAQLGQWLRAAQDIPTLAYNVIHQLCYYLEAPVGALYLLQGQELTLAGAYAYQPPASGPWKFALGEGLIGQAAENQQMMVLHDLPDHYMTILSGMGQMQPHHLVIVPFLYNRQVIGVIELGTFSEFSPVHLEFLNLATEALAMTFYTLQAHAKIDGRLFR